MRSSWTASGNATRLVGSQIQRPGKATIKLIAVGTAPIAVLLTLGVLGAFPGVVLIHQPINQCLIGTEQLNILNATFSGAAGQVTFALADGGTKSVTIVQAFAQGSGITDKVSTNLTNSNIVPPGGSLSLTLTFPGVTFQSGAMYTFTLVSACRSSFPFSIAA